MYDKVPVYFCELNPDSIINLDQPCHYPEFHSLPGYLETGTKETFDIVTELYFKRMEQFVGHWSNLLEHVGKWGILYPIIITTGLPKIRPLSSIPKEYRNTNSKFWMVCENQGGARILMAKKLGIKVPAIINDHVGLFHDRNPIIMKDLTEICAGVDEIVLSAQHGVQIKKFPRVHLDVDDIVYEESKFIAIQDIITNHLT